MCWFKKARADTAQWVKEWCAKRDSATLHQRHADCCAPRQWECGVTVANKLTNLGRIALTPRPCQRRDPPPTSRFVFPNSTHVTSPQPVVTSASKNPRRAHADRVSGLT